jgi:hypothetical protein
VASALREQTEKSRGLKETGLNFFEVAIGRLISERLFPVVFEAECLNDDRAKKRGLRALEAHLAEGAKRLSLRKRRDGLEITLDRSDMRFAPFKVFEKAASLLFVGEVGPTLGGRRTAPCEQRQRPAEITIMPRGMIGDMA